MKKLNAKQIRAHIFIATGADVRTFAASHQVHWATMYRAINNEIDSPNCRKIISDTIKIPEAEIWGVQDA